MKRVCSLPFVPSDCYPLALEVLDDCLDAITADSEVEVEVKQFSEDLIDYTQRNWLNGPFSVQDWNLFDIGKRYELVKYKIMKCILLVKKEYFTSRP